MTGKKFTPGPWVVEEDWTTDRDINGHTRGDKYIAGFDIASKDIQVITCEGISGSGPTERANAHLIAAAPDLYEALEKIMRMDLSWGYDKAMGKSQEIAYLALAKARGEA